MTGSGQAYSGTQQPRTPTAARADGGTHLHTPAGVHSWRGTGAGTGTGTGSRGTEHAMSGGAAG